MHAYLGDELFEQLMDAYIDRYPSHSTSLRDYSQHMGELLQTQSPFCDVPVLREIERIERAFIDSFDAADSALLDAAVLTAIPARDWPQLRLDFHPSVRLLSNEYNSFPIWQALSDTEAPPAVVRDPATWLVWRKDLVSCYRSLPPAEAEAMATAHAGGNVGELCQGLLEHHPEAEVPGQAVRMLHAWIEDGIVGRIANNCRL